MDVYKLRTGVQHVQRIEKERFERDTGKKFPWYQKNGNNMVQYAVCPACDNPIQLIALYKRNENSPKAYGKHIPHSVMGLTAYNQYAYDTCLYANPDLKLEKGSLRPENDQRSRDILTLLKEQFDRVIYILEKETGINFGEGLSQKMLQSFLAMHGDRYIGINMCNLPWIFGYMTASQSLFGQYIQNGSPLMESLKKCKELSFNGDQVKNAPGKFINLNFTFLGHKICHGSVFKESVEFVVSLEETTIFTKVMDVEPILFHNLINLSPGKERRQRLLNVAADIIPPYLEKICQDF